MLNEALKKATSKSISSSPKKKKVAERVSVVFTRIICEAMATS
jgi:hypothetical protein